MTTSPPLRWHSALIEAMQDDELQAVVAHEMAHVHLGHTTWVTLIGQPAGIGVPILSEVLQFFFRGWSLREARTEILTFLSTQLRNPL